MVVICFPFPCGLSLGASWLFKTTWIPCHVPTFSFKPSKGRASPSYASNLSHLFLYLIFSPAWESSLLSGLTWIILITFSILRFLTLIISEKPHLPCNNWQLLRIWCGCHLVGEGWYYSAFHNAVSNSILADGFVNTYLHFISIYLE